MMKSPILFIIFKREDTTARVFKRIREARPPRLYIAADGPRNNRIGEKEACEITRRVVENIDWPCEVHKLFREENLGCGKGVSSAITWFFQHESEGVILEDDILPHIDFFSYCDEMLEKYRDDTSIQMICGHSVFNEKFQNKSYYKSSFMQIWGWASWRRVWNTYEFDAAKIDKNNLLQKIQQRVPENAFLHFKDTYDMMSKHKDDTWDYQLFYNQMMFNRYSIISYTNQTYNIGFDSDDSTHTTGKNEQEDKNLAYSSYPIDHPICLCENKEADYINMINTGQYLSNHLDLLIRKIKRNIRPFLLKIGIYNKLKAFKYNYL